MVSHQKKFSKKFKKGIDKYRKIWYNISTVKERRGRTRKVIKMKNVVYVVMIGNVEDMAFTHIDSVFTSYEKAADYLCGLRAERADEELCDKLAEMDEEIADVWFNSGEIYTIVERKLN